MNSNFSYLMKSGLTKSNGSNIKANTKVTETGIHVALKRGQTIHGTIDFLAKN